MEARLLATGDSCRRSESRPSRVENLHHAAVSGRRVALRSAVISAGFENSFGHPHADVVARLANRHAAILRTDRDGLVTVRTDGRRLVLDTMAWRGASAWWRGERSFNWALAQGW